MDELERQLRETLAARAQDVSPTPALWEDVQERARRRRWMGWALSAGAAAAAVAAIVLVAPLALDALRDDVVPPKVLNSGPSETDPPTDDPSVEPTRPSPTASEPVVVPPTSTPTAPFDGDLADAVVTTDGTTIEMRTIEGGGVRTLYEIPREGESFIVSLAVRPGSTVDDLVVAFLATGEGMYDLRYLTVVDGGEATVEYFEEPYQISLNSMDVLMGTVPAPVWSPDGRHLAFLEEDDNGAITLRAIGWDEGPGTGRTADDNASFGLALDSEDDPTLEDWVWANGMGTETSGYLTLSRTRGAAGMLAIERQSDGGLAIPAGSAQFAAFTDPDGRFVVDHGDSHQNDGAAVGPEYTMSARGSDEGSIEYRIRVSGDGDLDEQMEMPSFLRDTPTTDANSAWMVARGDGVLVGFESRTWLVTRAGDVVEFLYDVTSAAFVD